MKITFHLILLFFFSNIYGQGFELRGPDNICSTATFQIYNNGILNLNPVSFTTSTNLQILSSSNSQISVKVINLIGSPCDPPQGYIFVLGAMNQIVAYRDCISLDCNFPIIGSNIIPYGVDAIYNIPRSYVTTGISCFGYTTWVISNNLEFSNNIPVLNTSKIIVHRINSGVASLTFYYGDGSVVKKYIN